jgi:hypothetical protein
MEVTINVTEKDLKLFKEISGKGLSAITERENHLWNALEMRLGFLVMFKMAGMVDRKEGSDV